MLTGDPCGVCNWHLSPAPFPRSRRGPAGPGAGPAPRLPPARLPVAGRPPRRATSGSRGLTGYDWLLSEPVRPSPAQVICLHLPNILPFFKKNPAMPTDFKLLSVSPSNTIFNDFRTCVARQALTRFLGRISYAGCFHFLPFLMHQKYNVIQGMR